MVTLALARIFGFISMRCWSICRTINGGHSSSYLKNEDNKKLYAEKAVTDYTQNMFIFRISHLEFDDKYKWMKTTNMFLFQFPVQWKQNISSLGRFVRIYSLRGTEADAIHRLIISIHLCTCCVSSMLRGHIIHPTIVRKHNTTENGHRSFFTNLLSSVIRSIVFIN